MTPDKTILAAIRLMYSGEDLEIMLKAWDKFPTYKEHCKLDKQRQEGRRKAFYEREKQLV